MTMLQNHQILVIQVLFNICNTHSCKSVFFLLSPLVSYEMARSENENWTVEGHLSITVLSKPVRRIEENGEKFSCWNEVFIKQGD